MPGWGKLVAGALIGAAGALYATNEELRKQLPRTARDLPVAVRRRFEAARTAGQEASARRRAEILRDLEPHGGDHARRGSLEALQEDVTPPELRELPPNPEEPAARATEDV
ncbi:MAG: hypothetical protein LC751_08555 [Actinobacteria bacterium]|nr:hypothetical protein [Actinomycetota bacterium]MCA1738206.1 hypothetical protein [Actinomycetota bacterium]